MSEQPDLDLDIEPDEDDVAVEDSMPRGLNLPVMTILPASVALPRLTQFVPDTRLKDAVSEASLVAAGVDVRGAEGLARADQALEHVRDTVKAVKAAFEEPCRVAHQVHERLTSMRADYLEAGEAAIAVVGRRIYVEQQRLKALEAEARRKAQAEADATAKAEARARAEEAALADAPPEVVESLQEHVESATAAPVHVEPLASPLKNTTIVKNWTVTVKGTPRDEELQQPSIEIATEYQRHQLDVLMAAILAKQAPVVCVTWNWPAITKLAKAGESTFSVEGLEAYDAGGVKGKAGRRRK